MVNNRKKVWNLQKAFSLRTIKVCRFEIIDGVKYVYCITNAYKFLLREQVGFASMCSLYHTVLHRSVTKICHICIFCTCLTVVYFTRVLNTWMMTRLTPSVLTAKSICVFCMEWLPLQPYQFREKIMADTITWLLKSVET